jgi:ABC-type lipoprotein release transport system permease subunit
VTGIALVILAIAAGVSPLLGVVGIYGVITYITAQQAGEVRIRVALGAKTGDITRLFVRHGLLPADDSTRAPRSVPSYLT